MTWYLGYGYALTPAWKLIASTSTAFLAPTMYQLYDADNGNASLKAERARSKELGIQYATGHTLVRATLFESHTRDQIDWQSTGVPFPWSGQYFNVNRASNSGLEVSIGSRIADVDMRVSLTLQNPTDDTTGQALLRRAKTHASLALSKSFAAWRVGGDVQFVGRRMDTTGELPSYVLANLNVRYKVNKEVSLYGRIENLFNRDYQTVYGYNQPPRGAFAGIEWRQQ
jgi:vitamin B12 transporter